MPTATLKATADGYYRLTAGSTEYTKILSDDNVYIVSGATQVARSFICEDMPAGALSVQAVRCALRFSLVGGSNHLGPGVLTRYASTDALVNAADDGIADAGERTWTYALTPPTGGWTPAIVSQAEFGFWDLQDSPTGGIFNVELFEVYVDYEGSPVRIENAREVSARPLLLGRRGDQLLEIDAPLWYADVRLGQLISVSHEEGETPSGTGWGHQPWERRPAMVLESYLDPQAMRMKIKALDVMQYVYLRSLWRTMRTKEAFSPDQQGAVKLDVGAATECLRDSQAWVQNPPDGIWKRAEKNVERVGLDGVRIEPRRANAQPYPSFNSGYGSGGFYAIVAGSGAVTNDSSVLWFDPELIQYSLKMSSHATSHTVATTVTGTATAAAYYASGRDVRVSVYHLEDVFASSFLAVRIVRTVDGRFWNDAAATWDVGIVDNPIPASLTRDIWRSKVVGVGAAATGLQLVFAIPAGAIAAKNAWIFHSQHEEGRWASSPIAGGVDATPAAREVEALRVSTSNPPHVWPLERGTVWLDFIADWDSSDLAGSVVLFDVNHQGTDFTRLRYDYTTGAWVFYESVLGSVCSASLVQAVMRGTRYRIVVRWCSELGEWGLAPRTMSIWAGPASGNGWVRGTDGIPVGRMPSVPLATRNVWFGGKDMTAKAQAGGQISNIVITPLCLPDWMIADLG